MLRRARIWALAACLLAPSAEATTIPGRADGLLDRAAYQEAALRPGVAGEPLSLLGSPLEALPSHFFVYSLEPPPAPPPGAAWEALLLGALLLALALWRGRGLLPLDKRPR